jgi:IS5 family transposase
VQSVIGTAANVNDVIEANALLHGDECAAFADAGYQGAHKRPDAKQDVVWIWCPSRRSGVRSTPRDTRNSSQGTAAQASPFKCESIAAVVRENLYSIP